MPAAEQRRSRRDAHGVQRRASDEVIALDGHDLDTATQQLHAAAAPYLDDPANSPTTGCCW